MAYILNDDEEQKKREQEQGIPVSGTQTGSLQGTEKPVENTAKPNSAFVDVASYLNANKPQALETAGRVAGKLDTERNTLSSSIRDTSNQYGQKIDTGTIRPDTDLVERAATNPTDFIKNSADFDKFKHQRDAQYTGPGSFSESQDYANLSNSVKTAQEKAKGIDTQAGRKSYLYEIGNNPTAGVVSLDDLLIGQDPNARQKLTQSAEQFNTLAPSLESETKNLSDKLANARAQTEQAKTGVQNRFLGENGVVPAFDKDLQGRVSDERSKALNKQKDYQDLIKAGKPLTDEQYASLGITGTDWNSLQNNRAWLNTDWKTNFDVSPYLTNRNPDVEITKGNVASSDDYAKEAAFQKLLGNDLPILNDNDSNIAGTFNRNLFDFNKDAFSNSSNLLKEKDLILLNELLNGQNEATIPGVVGMVPNVNVSNYGFEHNPEGYKNYYDLAYNVLNRNQDGLPQVEKDWLNWWGPYLSGSTNVMPTTGSSQPPPRSLQPTTPEGNIPSSETGRLRIRDGQQQWFDGNNWITAPTEVIYRDANGNQTGPTSGSQPFQFNFNTGTYEKLGDVIQPPPEAPSIPAVPTVPYIPIVRETPPPIPPNLPTPPVGGYPEPNIPPPDDGGTYSWDPIALRWIVKRDTPTPPAGPPYSPPGGEWYRIVNGLVYRFNSQTNQYDPPRPSRPGVVRAF